MAIIRVWLTLFLLLAWSSQSASQDKPLFAASGERILSYSSEVDIARDGSLNVTETIRVQAEGNQIRRGIYRDFPTRYERQGRTIRVGFDVAQVLRDGREEAWTTESIDRGTRVRIGSEDVFISPGEHVYTIRYQTTRQLGFFETYGELYWNVTGNGWAFPIDVAEVLVRLPQATGFGQRAFYTGPQGAKESNAEIVDEGPGRIRIRTTSGLGPGEGLTIAVAFPKGIVEPPPPISASDEWMERNFPLIAAGLALVGLGFYYFHAWRRAGRGPVPGTIVPLFAPPEGMSAAGVRFVREMGYDNRVFAAAVVESGVQGKIRLTEEDGGFFSRSKTRMSKTAEPDDLQGPERNMLRALFAGGDEIEMDKKNHSMFRSAQRQLQEGLDSLYRDKLFRKNSLWAVAGFVVLLGAMMIVGAAVLATDVYGESGRWMAPIFGIGLLLVAVWAGGRSRFVSKQGSILMAVLCCLLVIGGIAVLIATIAFAGESGRAWPIFLPLLSLPLVISAFWWMAAPTREGRAVMDEIAGFEKYLSVTEEDRLERLHPPEKTPELFERLLPFAIALEVENRWASRFEDVLARAAQQPDQQNRMGWYSGSHSPWSNPGRFATAMGGALASSVSAASTAPGSSSGSGGGGSSGGGGGGGGGGGW